MWSRSQARASRPHQGKTQCRSRRMTSSRIHGGGSCRSTASVRFRSRTGWILAFGSWSQVRIRSSGGGAEAARPRRRPVRRGEVGGEVGQRTVHVEVWSDTAAAATAGGRPASSLVRVEVEVALAGGDDAEGLGLAGLVVVGVAEPAEQLGFVADQVVERGQVGGVAGGVEPGGAGEVAGPGVGEGDVPAVRGWPAPSSACSSGANRAAASATIRSIVGSPNPSTRAASCSSTHRAPPTGRERVSAATRRVFHGATARTSTCGPEPREPVPQVQGVGHQRHRRLGGDPHRGTERLGHERRHTRGAVAAERGVAVAEPGQTRRRPRSPYPTRRWPGAARTTGRRAAACGAAPPVRRSASAAASSRPAVVEVLDLDRRGVLPASMGQLNQRPPTVTGCRKPLSTRGSGGFETVAARPPQPLDEESPDALGRVRLGGAALLRRPAPSSSSRTTSGESAPNAAPVPTLHGSRGKDLMRRWPSPPTDDGMIRMACTSSSVSLQLLEEAETAGRPVTNC